MITATKKDGFSKRWSFPLSWPRWFWGWMIFANQHNQIQLGWVCYRPTGTQLLNHHVTPSMLTFTLSNVKRRGGRTHPCGVSMASDKMWHVVTSQYQNVWMNVVINRKSIQMSHTRVEVSKNLIKKGTSCTITSPTGCKRKYIQVCLNFVSQLVLNKPLRGFRDMWC